VFNIKNMVAFRENNICRSVRDGQPFSSFSGTDMEEYCVLRQGIDEVSETFIEETKSRKPRPLPPRVHQEASVLVIGGGLAGLSAALAAAEAGATVTLLEKTQHVGGNSAKATSGINGWGTEAQEAYGIDDGPGLFERDTVISGHGGSVRTELVAMLSAQSGDAVRFLSKHGVNLTVLAQLGGHSRMRTHRAPDNADGTPVPIGYAIVRALQARLREVPGVTVVTAATALRLVVRDGRVRGVVYESDGVERELHSDAVVLTTGGFSHDRTGDSSLLREFFPEALRYPTTNGPFATGDGVKMAREIGAVLVDMDRVQLHPTGLVDPKRPDAPTKFLGPEALRGAGGVLVNARGRRFVDELGLRSAVTAAITAQADEYPGSEGSRVAYCVLNDAAAGRFGRGALRFYTERLGLFRVAADVDELAQMIGCRAATLRETLDQYGAVSASGSVCPVTGKSVYPTVLNSSGPFHVAVVTPSVHYTMGGCLISPLGEVQRSLAGGGTEAIPGLFAAGEVTGGVHGANRLAGNSLLECVVFGRLAGISAVLSGRSLSSQGVTKNSTISPYRIQLVEVLEDKVDEESTVVKINAALVVDGPVVAECLQVCIYGDEPAEHLLRASLQPSSLWKLNVVVEDRWERAMWLVTKEMFSAVNVRCTQ
jgi:flavocytochrome c